MTQIPETMRAIRYTAHGGAEVLSYDQVPMPQPGDGEVLIEVAAAALNYADVMRRRNMYLEPTPVPYIPGSEIAGTVVALGPGVPEGGPLRVGARVVTLTGNGGYAQYAAVPARGVIPLPEGLDFVTAAAIPLQGLTAYLTLHTSARFQPGESVLIPAAAGGVGTLAVQLAKLGGAGKVIAAASTSEKLALARSLGADECVNYTSEDLVARVNEITNGKGVDIVLESVGGEIFAQCIRCLAPFGRLVTFGSASQQRGEVDTIRLMQRNASVIGFWLAVFPGKLIAEAMQALLTAIANGQLRPIIGGTYPLAEAARAQTDMEGRGTTGKLILQVE